AGLCKTERPGIVKTATATPSGCLYQPRAPRFRFHPSGARRSNFRSLALPPAATLPPRNPPPSPERNEPASTSRRDTLLIVMAKPASQLSGWPAPSPQPSWPDLSMTEGFAPAPFAGRGLLCRRGERLVFRGLDFDLAPGG